MRFQLLSHSNSLALKATSIINYLNVCSRWSVLEFLVRNFLKTSYTVHSYFLLFLRPDQINYLFHGSGGSVFIALGIKLIDGHGLACMARQRLVIDFSHLVTIEMGRRRDSYLCYSQ